MPRPLSAAPQCQHGGVQVSPCYLRPYGRGLLPRSLTAPFAVWMHWQTPQARYVWVDVSRRARHASCESPCHASAKRHLWDTCLLRMAPFRSMLLTLQSGLKSFAPRARWVPVYPVVFLTFLHAACTAHEAVAPGYPGGPPLLRRRGRVHTERRGRRKLNDPGSKYLVLY